LRASRSFAALRMTGLEQWMKAREEVCGLHKGARLAPCPLSLRE
jgi:hypothetical protein